MSSRLFMQVRERRGLCYSIYAGHHALEDTGMFNISAGLDKMRLREAIQAIWHELDGMCLSGVKADELRRAKDHIRGKWMLAFEDSANQADWYGKQLIFQGKTLSPDERMDAIEAVEAADIRVLARELFDVDRVALSVVGPYRTKRQVEKMVEKTSPS
jgi:predicted Zn-dependent peptidase